MHPKLWLAAIAMAAGLLTAVAVPALAEDDDEVKVKYEDVPEAVRKTMEKEAPGVKITEVEKEIEDGKTIYEAEVTIAGQVHEIEVAEDGTLISNEVEDEGEEEGQEDDDDMEEDDDEDDDEEDDGGRRESQKQR